jgi:hypothetical protein
MPDIKTKQRYEDIEGYLPQYNRKQDFGERWKETVRKWALKSGLTGSRRDESKFRFIKINGKGGCVFACRIKGKRLLVHKCRRDYCSESAYYIIFDCP